MDKRKEGEKKRGREEGGRKERKGKIFYNKYAWPRVSKHISKMRARTERLEDPGET